VGIVIRQAGKMIEESRRPLRRENLPGTRARFSINDGILCPIRRENIANGIVRASQTGS
jgi:hypothetical protein